MSRLRNFVFTINNYIPEDYELLKAIDYSYLIIGTEVGENGTPHYQGYCELKKQTRWKSIKTQIPRGYFDARKGTAVQASEYCKKDMKFEEFGELSAPGKRNDLLDMYDSIKDEKTNIEVQELYPATYMRYYKAVDRVRLNLLRENREWAPMKVTLLIGESGIGKSHRTRQIDRDAYQFMHQKDLWWDGYVGQKTLLLDDYYGWIPYGLFLNLLDGYKFQLPIKGGFTWKSWTHVIITSNAHPCTWYTQGITPALKRRLLGVKSDSKVVDNITHNLCDSELNPEKYLDCETHLEKLF